MLKQNISPARIALLTLCGIAGGLVLALVIGNMPETSRGQDSDPFTATLVNGGSTNVLHHILITGQSLSVGWQGKPPLTTQPYFDNKMLNSNRTALVPLVEKEMESIGSSMARWISDHAGGNDYKIVVTHNGKGSTPYIGLKRGTQPYNDGMADIKAAKALTPAGMTYRVDAIVTIHGESDHVAGSDSILVNEDSDRNHNGKIDQILQYTQFLERWQIHYENDINGNTKTIPMFTDQTSSHTGYGDAISRMPLAQLAAYERNPNKIILVTPKYIFPYADAAHLKNTGYRWLGAYYGKVMKKVLIDKQPWRPLMPRTITRKGSIITALFDVPVGPLVLDTTLVDKQWQFGFEYENDKSNAKISTVELTPGTTDSVTITLDKTPATGKELLRYAFTGTPGAKPGPSDVINPQIRGSARGNLRDSDPAKGEDGETLYNWSVHFSRPITIIP